MLKVNLKKAQKADFKLNSWYPAGKLEFPKSGWIKTIRESLSISTRALASSLGVSQSRVVHMEKAEIEGNLTLDTLKDAAKAMDCQLVYAIVPNISLEYTIKKRITQVAKDRTKAKINKLDHVVMLSKHEMSKLILKEAQRLHEGSSKDLWA